MNKALATTIFLALIALPSSAWAFLCTTIGDIGPSVYWSSRIVSYVLDKKGTADIEGHSELDTLRESFDVWNSVTCSDFTFEEDTESAYDGRIGFDYLNAQNNQNALVFYDTDWPHSSLTIALTTLTINNFTGQILDADIEFNSSDFKYTNTDIRIKTDLKNTAVHEIGHMLGLEHVVNTASVMYPYASTGETRCRELFPDDEEAICFRYPTAEENGFCSENSACKNHCRAPRAMKPEEAKVSITLRHPSSGCNQSGHDSSLLWLFMAGAIWLIKRNYCS